ncbi:ABC transporter substrate-binding protein [Lutibacter sp. TH_r2]|uniref:ABC transporter substrate-binding protein n=1 Tax=Lutibacter sp. TH_r2 TaxID=3082083 RepID=UPI002954CDDA|nr:ABC transporter substrate-binding protein [Lutibacter sp. TH_r2]MDV7187540.1 ABC transporter substrate-binding protein [Lutibacter sp. TH_r2]
MKKIQPTFYLILLLTIFSCNTNSEKKITNNSKSVIKYAKGFDIVKTGDQTNLIIKSPFPDAKEKTIYKIVSEKSSNINEIQTPLNSIVVTSTTHIPVLELLNVENKLVGFPNTNFISSKKTRDLIDKNVVKDLGHPDHINTESLLELKPDIVMGFSVNGNTKMFSTIEKIGIPVIFNGAWLEETPLGRAEWIKLFGILFDKEKLADSVFTKIEKSYLEAKKIALNSKTKPSVICGGLYRDVWYMPAGNSFEATFLKDANTNYLWKNSSGTGSLSLNVENVFDKGQTAEFWFSPGMYKTKNDLEKSNHISSKMDAFKNNSIFSYNNTQGETGGIIYFELSPIRPDLVLKDLIKITHPDLLPNYNLTFYKKLN